MMVMMVMVMLIRIDGEDLGPVPLVTRALAHITGSISSC